jgi:hypothetical protein
MNEEALNKFWYWIRAREQIRLLKEKYPEGLEGGYSDDPILNTYHFCNVRREDDRGTKEIREVVLEFFPPEDTDMATISSLPTVYLMARLFNHAPTVRRVLEACDYGASIEEAFQLLKDYRDDFPKQAKIFNPAYVVSTAGESMDKIDYVLRLVLAAQKVIIPTDSLANAHAALSTIPGLGGTGFLAGQVVADLRNDRYLVAAAAHQDWCCPGPGSIKGMDFIFCEESNRSVTSTKQGNFMARMGILYDVMPDDIWNMELHAQDLQNCLCEFSKYMRLSDPRLKSRKRYYKRGEK